MEASPRSSVPDVLRIIVPGPPHPAARPRAEPLMRNGRPVLERKSGRPIIHMHMPDENIDYEKHVAACALGAAVSQRWVIPEAGTRLGIVVRVYRLARRGDLDNYAKAVLDGITKCGRVWADDRFVVSANLAMAVSKERPRVEVEIRVLEGGA